MADNPFKLFSPAAVASRVKDFWTWFDEARPRLEKRIADGSFTKADFARGSRHLNGSNSPLPDTIAWELGRAKDGKFELTITGDSIAQHFAEMFIQAAPELPGWRWFSARRASPGAKVKMFGLTCDPADARFVFDLVADYRLLSTTMWHPAFEELGYTDAESLGERILNVALGEEQVQTWLFDPLRTSTEQPAGAVDLDGLRAAIAGLQKTEAPWVSLGVENDRTIQSPWMIRGRPGLKKSEHPGFIEAVPLSLTYEAMPNGLPDRAALQRLESFERQLVSALQGMAIFNGMRCQSAKATYYFHVLPGTAMALKSVAGRHEQVTLEEVELDIHWSKPRWMRPEGGPPRGERERLKTEARAKAFWAWFTEASPRIEARLADDSITKDDFLPGVALLNKGFARGAPGAMRWGIGQASDGKFELALFGNGNSALRQTAEQIVRAAPKLSRWRFLGARPPADGKKVRAFGESWEVDAGQFLFKTDPVHRTMEVDMWHPGFAKQDPFMLGEAADELMGALLGQDTFDSYVTRVNEKRKKLPGKPVGLRELRAAIAQLQQTEPVFVTEIRENKRDNTRWEIRACAGQKWLEHLDCDYLLLVSLPYTAEASGLPTAEERKRVNALERTLLEAVGAQAVFHGTQLGSSNAVWAFHVPPGVDALVRLWAKKHAKSAEITMEPDDGWKRPGWIPKPEW